MHPSNHCFGNATDGTSQVAPGICDGISARCALEAGFDCLYQSGAATTASRLGMPDLAIATLNDFVEAGAMHASLDPTVPVIADADTGWVSPPVPCMIQLLTNIQ